MSFSRPRRARGPQAGKTAGKTLPATGLRDNHARYDAAGQLVAEYSEAANPESGTQYLTADHLGSTRLVTDAAGEIVHETDYYPFGEEMVGGDWLNPKFTAKLRDYESGLNLDYFGARYYASAMGRFTSADPLLASGRTHDPQSWNRYAYARNNPLRFIDPTGLDYYDQSGNRIGASDDDEDYVVTDRADIRQIRQNTRNDQPTAVDNVGSAILLPGATVRTEIGAAVQRSNQPNGQDPGQDPQGGFHEEGGMWGLDEGGSQIAVPAAAGPYADLAGGATVAQIDPGRAANPADQGRVVTPEGFYHVHPRGQVTVNGQIRAFNQPPSAADIGNAVTMNVVVGARNRTVYFYNNQGTRARMPLNRFLRIR